MCSLHCAHELPLPLFVKEPIGVCIHRQLPLTGIADPVTGHAAHSEAN